MRRLLLPALAFALLVGTFAGVASARFADSGSGPAAPDAAPFRVPASQPRPDATQPGAHGFRSSTAIGAALDRTAGGGDPSSAPASGASASVTVTAVVLPVVFIVLDERGRVDELVTNTDARDARDVLFLVREGDATGPGRELTARVWAQARVALREAGAGTGTIWRR